MNIYLNLCLFEFFSFKGVVKLKFDPKSPKKIAKFDLEFGEGIIFLLNFMLNCINIIFK